MATEKATPTLATNPAIAAALHAHAEIRFLLRAWDVLAEPHVLHAQFSAIESRARAAERALHALDRQGKAAAA